MVFVPSVFQPDDGACVPEAHIVMQMTVDDFITLIHSYIQVGGLWRRLTAIFLWDWQVTTSDFTGCATGQASSAGGKWLLPQHL